MATTTHNRLNADGSVPSYFPCLWPVWSITKGGRHVGQHDNSYENALHRAREAGEDVELEPIKHMHLVQCTDAEVTAIADLYKAANSMRRSFSKPPRFTVSESNVSPK